MEDLNIIETHLFELLKKLELDLSESKISEKEYNKSMILLSYEYSMLGLTDNALLTFINVKDDYFNKDGLEDLEEDSDFCQKCNFLLVIFDYIGAVPPESMCNVPSAKA